MQRAFLDVNGVKTNVLTYGKWVEESPSHQPEDIILVIPGNPGVTGFYKMFLHTLHEKTGFPVWIVGHAGHDNPNKNALVNSQPLKGNEEVFGLKGQIKHKREFIKKYVPANARVHLVGHSIGTYVILELLKDEEFNSRVVDVNFLFPTIEHMADTPNGKFLTTFIKPIVWLIVFLSWIYTILPSILQGFLMYIYMKIVGLPKMHFRTLVHFIDPSIMEKVFFMAFEELEQVRQRDGEVIKRNKDKIKFLYGRGDGWAPASYYEKLKNEIVGVNAELSDFDHAFVLKQSRQIGSLVGEWITSQKKSN